jgi:hypothetical protein
MNELGKIKIRLKECNESVDKNVRLTNLSYIVK